MKKRKLTDGVILALLAAAIFTGDCNKSYSSESVVPPIICPYCEELGYICGESGGNSVCIFPDNTSCSDWGFYRGECGTQWSYCEKNGGELKNIVDNMGKWTASYGVCVFSDGSECLEQDYQEDKCKPSECTEWLMSKGGCIKPDNSSICPAQKVLGADNPQLENLRDFRDSKLANSAVGRKVIQIYYNNAEDINAALERSPALRAATRKVLEVIAPMVGKN